MAIKIGVIGCGYWGPNLIRNFNQLDSTDLWYICDVDEERMAPLKKAYPGVKTATDYRIVLDDSDVDAVVVAVPVAKHFQIAKEALLRNKHVLIEKPMTASVREAEELIKIAKEKNKVLMVDHTFEYAGAINKIKEIIDSGSIGDLYYIRADWLNLGLLQPDVNVIWDLAIHISSIIGYISELKPLSLSANAAAYIRKNIPEIAHIHIKFPKGITGYITVSWLEPRKTRAITIVGSKKLIVYDLINEEEQIKVYDKGVDISKDIKDVRQFRINYRYGDIYSPNVDKVEPLKMMCSHFADCIINKKTPRSDGNSGLAIVKILEAAEESLRNHGREVKIS